METKQNSNARRWTIKMTVLALLTLLLSVFLLMVNEVVSERKDVKKAVEREVAASYARNQMVDAPELVSTVLVKSFKNQDVKEKVDRSMMCETLSYVADVETKELHRSIYDVIAYNSKVDVTGCFAVTEDVAMAVKNKIVMNVTDYKGLSNLPTLRFGEKTYEMLLSDGDLIAEVELPNSVKVGDSINFAVKLDLRGTSSISFIPSAKKTTLTVTSAYPHPSFYGEYLPEHREVCSDGFKAMWSVQNLSPTSSCTCIYDEMGVRFVDPVDPYLQTERSMKYGLLIIVLVFVAGLVVEFLTRKEINLVQYAVIGLSLVLFYSLLLAFSEFITFGVAYAIAALMTNVALMFYFKGILKNRSAYLLGMFVALVYAVNYVLLQMETYAFLAGSLVLFFLLCVVMYLTANHPNKVEESQDTAA